MRSIRRQLTRRLVLWLVGLFCAGLTGIHVAVWRILLENVDAGLRTRALALAALSEVKDGRVQFDFSEDLLASYRHGHPHAWFEIRDPHGTLLARSPGLGDDGLAGQDGGTPKHPRFYNLRLPEDRRGRAAALSFVVPETDSPAPPPQLRLVVAVDRRELDETLAGLFAAVLGCGLLLGGATVVLVPRILTRGLAPLDALGEQAAAIDAASLGTRFSADALPAELQPIARRLNDLLARLEASFERERQFSADLAHELRTPVAELRAMAECALKWPEARDLSLDREVLAIAQQMERIVTHLLALTRGEEGRLAVEFAPVAVDVFVRELWADFAPRAADRGLSVETALAPGTAEIDPGLLRAILTNLFENAVGYAAVPGTLRLAVEVRAGSVAVTVANTVSDLAADDVERMFDRLWRKEPSRTDSTHAGLGLALARTFARAMGWRLTARLTDKRTIALVLSGPPAAPQVVSGQ